MLDALEDCTRTVRRMVGELDPDRIAPSQADRLLSAFVALERAAVAGKLLCAARGAQSDTWRQEGHPTPASWLAKRVGTEVGPATAALSTAEQLSTMPVLADALRRGELSEAQAALIAKSAGVAPAAEDALVEAAGRQSLTTLRAHARRLEAVAGLDDPARMEAVRKTRYLRHWREADGAFRLSCRMTEDTGLRILEAVDAGVEAVWEEALKQHRAGDSMEAYRLDSLERLVVRGDRCAWDHRGEQPGAGRPRGRTVHLRVDAAALRRASLEEGDVCEVPGVGTVSLAAARSILADSVIEVVMADGVDVTTIAHVGRDVSGAVETALAERDPVCVVPRCDQAHDLEVVEVRFQDGGPSGLANLARLCGHHHRLKTYYDYTLTGSPGQWEFTSPDGVTWTEHLASTHPDGDPRDQALWSDPGPDLGRPDTTAHGPPLRDTG